MRTVAAVVAGPSASPLLAPLAGRPVIEHAVAAFEAAPLVGEILVVTPPALAARAARLLAAGGYRKLSRVIGGSATRAESVRRAIGALGGAGGNLLIHDATRPLVSPRVIADCAAALRDCRAVCAAV